MTAFPVDQDRVARELWQSELRFMSWPERSWNEVVGTEREAYLALAAVAVAAVLEDLQLRQGWSVFRPPMNDYSAAARVDVRSLELARELRDLYNRHEHLPPCRIESQLVGPWRVVEEPPK